MSKWYDDKDSVKEVFDGIRNYLYCGVLFYAGVVNFSEASTNVIVNCLYFVLGVAFCLSALYLLFVNSKLLFKSFVSKRKSMFSYVVSCFIFPLVVIQFAIFALTHESEQVKMKNGHIVGEIRVPDTFVPDFLLDKTN
ncbi:hypothetical protein [Vibrio alginolyticus]|uniref:hypothetical protein n=1 Tax=Vibrio alginolyticus TaxID=663 RepID=UPI002160F3E7|nr:hypothetical protein [Vibrio alginolyticus]MCS0268649.1 hypothetical protein [Vibrio alginolyticus]